ncbi:uncharacterized protein LOC124924090 [Impatiens glandulifera]|uniref:uncharacterized protein LOC124924090 n=1 Tax=Impatiens glandulifera TaxID=253017 RepID=UPI001FB13500|nr:uncharacterized protein LOC124924090 [Impatiens glandulifera]XP_047320100.1 uncharacterized protein LOC124924090 [Impatiens glandulifera]
MCILCVIQKWSRRVATMLPWLVIPLIGLWALSQLLPPAFRFEITSPRLACVFVLLVTLFWYEILMPQLSAWRARRNARLRERKRFEAIEMQKLRKTATRRCRNCLTPYRDQNPGGGRFMCSYCGHISKRPVLDLPVPPGFGLSNSGILKDLVGKGGNILNGKAWSDNSWTCRQDWLENGNWVSGQFTGNNYGQKNGVGFFSCDEDCMTEKSYSRVMIFACKITSVLFWSIGWFWSKVSRASLSRDVSSDTEDKGLLARQGENFQESRVEKARRKAEEKRQARVEKELLEEEERKQKEEVARLVEERRKLRDENMEVEKDRKKGSTTSTEKNSKKEAEKKRREKKKDKDKASSKSNSDAEEIEKRGGKENERKGDNDKPDLHRSGAENGKINGTGVLYGIKSNANSNHGRGNTGTHYLDRMKGTILSSSKAFGSNSFFRRGVNTSPMVSRESKSGGFVDHINTSANRNDFSQHGKPNMSGDDKSISRPVLIEPPPIAAPKKSWQQLFTRSSAVSPPPPVSNVISRPNSKPQIEVHSPPSITYDNPISFGFPSPFTLPTFPLVSTSSTSTVVPLNSETMFAARDLLPEESDIFEDPCYVPDPVSLLGPVSESLENFQLDLGTGFIGEFGSEKLRPLRNTSSAMPEIIRPSPIERSCNSNRSPKSVSNNIQEFHNFPVEASNHSNEQGTYQMWNTSPLFPRELNIPGKEDVMHQLLAQKTMESLFTNDEQTISSIHSQNNFLQNQNTGTFGTFLSGPVDTPWEAKTLSGFENQFSMDTREERVQKEIVYGSSIPIGSTSHLPQPNCWTKKEAVVGSKDVVGKSRIGSHNHHQHPVGSLFSPPEVGSLWSSSSYG